MGQAGGADVYGVHPHRAVVPHMDRRRAGMVWAMSVIETMLAQALELISPEEYPALAEWARARRPARGSGHKKGRQRVSKTRWRQGKHNTPSL